MRPLIQFRLRPWMMHPIARRGLMVANWCLAIAPLTFLITAVGAATQATKILGTVPKPSINDPYLFGQDDPVYQAWLHGAGLSMGATVLSLIPWCLLTAVTIFAHWRYWAKTDARPMTIYRFLPIGLYLISWAVLIWEPVGLLTWLLD